MLKRLQPRVAAMPNRVQTLTVDQRTGAASWRASSDRNSSANGYGWKWRKARVEHLRAHPLCDACETEGLFEPATVVDHRIPHRGDAGLFWDRTNWQSLCASHHSADKQSAEVADARIPDEPIPRG